ncbi:MAG: hypothetical protein EOL97_15790, partial [Spirochaetia bacterium]|nr:hypothetical protein [Spirochaetia bacterium]
MNEYGLPQLVDFNRTYATLVNNLANTLSIEEISDRIEELATGGMPEAMVIKDKIPFKNINSIEDYYLVVQFAQAMSKYFNEMSITIMDSNGGYSKKNITKEATQSRVLREWKNNEEKSRVNNSKYFNQDKTYNVVNIVNDFKKIGTNNVIPFLKILGIELSLKDKYNISNIVNNADIILTQFKKNLKEDKESVSLFSNTESSNLSGNLNRLVEEELKLNPYNFNENMFYNINGDKIYGSVLYSFFSRIISKIPKVKDADSFKRLFPHLDNDVYSGSSILVNKLRKGNLTLTSEVINGNATASNESRKEFNKLELADRVVIAYNEHLKGNYALLRPEANKQERFLGHGKLINETLNVVGEDVSIYDKMIDYLMDELDFIAANDNTIDGVVNDGIILSVIGKFDKNVKEELIKLALTNDHISYFDTAREDKLKDYFKTFFENNTKKLYKTLGELYLIKGSGDKVTRSIIDFGSLDGNEIKNKLKHFLVNDFVSKVEQTKLISGNPVYYGSALKFFKRMGGAVGTKDSSFTDSYVNTFIENKQEYINKLVKGKNNITDGVTTQYSEDGSQVITRIATLEDVIAYTDNFDGLNLTKEEIKLYHNMTEGDGIGFITIDEWRRMLIRNGDYIFSKSGHDGFYQWELQELTGVPKKDRIYIDPETLEESKLTKPNFVANSLKVQGFGSVAGNSFI